MTREQALKILSQNISNENLKKHSLAVEAIMRGLTRHFKQDEEKWGLAGLLHDIDYEKTKDNPEQHSLIGAKMLQDLGLDEEICQAVRTHNAIHGEPPLTLLAKALFVADAVSGLIVAATLVLPSKKIQDLKVDNVLHRFKEKAFARGVNREHILRCTEYLGLSLEEFIDISLKAMKEIAPDLGL